MLVQKSDCKDRDRFDAFIKSIAALGTGELSTSRMAGLPCGAIQRCLTAYAFIVIPKAQKGTFIAFKLHDCLPAQPGTLTITCLSF